MTEAAAAGIDRYRTFLHERNPEASNRASVEIARALGRLATSHEIGRPVRGDADLRELVIRFGASGYVALYRHDNSGEAVIVLAFRHQREAGY